MKSNTKVNDIKSYEKDEDLENDSTLKDTEENFEANNERTIPITDEGDDILQGAVPCDAKPQETAARGEGGGISIVNSNCGKRIEFSKKALAALDEPEFVQFFFKGKYLIIKADQQGFPLRKMGARKVTYCAGLVTEITDKFSIDFSGRSCISFSDFKKVENGDVTAIAVTIK